MHVDAEDPEEAKRLAERMFAEASERVWGPGTRTSAERVTTAIQRDEELDTEAG